MNTIQLECFLTVAKYLNFSKAAEEIKITQPAVSHQIQSLEEELGIKLFHRTSKSVSMTQEGILFFPDADRILKISLSAKERLRSLERPLYLEIGCHTQSDLNLLPPVLKKLKEEFPLLHPSVHSVPFAALSSLLESGQLHVMFGLDDSSKNISLWYKEFFKPRVCAVCSKNHPFSRLKTVKKEDLSGNIILCDPHRISGILFQIQNSIAASASAVERYFSDSYESALTLVKADIGYTILPEILPEQNPDLCYIPITDISRLSFGIYYTKMSDIPVVRRFHQLLKERIEASL